MANYPDRKQAVPARNAPRQSKSGFIAWLVLAFVCGYTFAWFYSPVLVATWIQTHFGINQPVEKSGVELAKLPKPKFEFYTLLTQEKLAQDKIKLPEAVAVPVSPKLALTPSPVVGVNDKKGLYVLQLASFQRREDAEHMLADLVIRGFEASIKTTTQQGTAWHRVVMGPFPSRLQAEKVQGNIATRERISGIIRRMES